MVILIFQKLLPPPPQKKIKIKKIIRDNKLKKKTKRTDNFCTSDIQSVCSIGVVFLTLILTRKHLIMTIFYRRHCSYFIMAHWSKAVGFWVRSRSNLWVNDIEMILRNSYFHKKVYIVCYLNIHIYYMLPHLWLSNYFVSIWETLSRCNEPHEFK